MGHANGSPSAPDAALTLARRLRLCVAIALVITGVAYRPPVAGAAVADAVWDAKADFDNNQSTTHLPTTMSGAATAMSAGSVTLQPEAGCSPVVAVDAAGCTTVALKRNGTVAGVGQGAYGCLNFSTWTDIVAVDTCGFHTVGLRRDGTAVAVGSNDWGQTNVSSWTDIVAVAVGGQTTVGLRSDGTVVAVGRNDFGQADVSSWTDIVAISVGDYHTVGVKRDGTVVAVGRNNYGQTDVSTWTDVVAIAAGSYHTVGVKRDGTAVAVGWDPYGVTDVPPLTDIVGVSTGFSHTLYLRADGTVVPAGAMGGSDILAWTDIVAVAAGSNHSVGLKSDGTLVGAGVNNHGQTTFQSWSGITAIASGRGWGCTLGLRSDGTLLANGTDEYGAVYAPPWTDIVAIAAGDLRFLGMKRDGTVEGLPQEGVEPWTDIVAIAAGSNQYMGVRADGTVAAWQDLPPDFPQEDVTSWTDIVAVAAGTDHSVGLKRDGTVVATGRTLEGQTDVSSWTDIVAIAAGDLHTVGLKRDGTVVATGLGLDGQTQVSAWTDIVAVAAGSKHTVGLKRDGTVVATGSNLVGQCDVGPWRDITAISAGACNTVGLKSDGTVVALGENWGGAANVAAWEAASASPRMGMIGGSGPAVGLRCDVPSGDVVDRIEVEHAPLTTSQAVKLALRVSQDGVTWSEPLGSDGKPIDWTTGTGNYLGRAATDSSQRTQVTSLPPGAHVDIVVRLESSSVLSPEVFRVAAHFVPGDPFEPDNSPLEARPIQLNQWVDGTLVSAGDSDWLSFTPEVGKDYYFDASAVDSDCAAWATVVGAEGQELGGLHIANGGGGWVILQALGRPEGPLFVRLEGAGMYRVRIAEGGRITGRVTSEVSGGALSDVSVTCADQLSTAGGGASRSDGTFEVYPVHPDTYTVSFHKNGYTYEWFDDKPDRASATFFAVGPGQTISGIDAALTPAAGQSLEPSVSCQPAQPDGLSGWFTSQPSVGLGVENPDGAVYFSLNSGAPTKYSDRIQIPEGRNQLEYWVMESWNDGSAEATRYAESRMELNYDGTAPSAPGALEVTSVSNTGFKVSWPASADEVSGVSGYRVYVDGTLASSSATTWATIDHRPAGTTFNVEVEAIDVAGNVSPRVAVQATTASSGTEVVDVTPGSDVVVVVPGGGALKFAQVDAPGTIHFSSIDPRAEATDASFRILHGGYFDIHVDASFTGPVEVTIPYDEAALTGWQSASLEQREVMEGNLKLRHQKAGGGWEDITVSVDTVNNTITGRTMSFSDFWIEEPAGSGNWVNVGADADLPPALWVSAVVAATIAMRLRRRRAA